eukprot:2583730-Prymnesium_polylepis.3
MSPPQPVGRKNIASTECGSWSKKTAESKMSSSSACNARQIARALLSIGSHRESRSRGFDRPRASKLTEFVVVPHLLIRFLRTERDLVAPLHHCCEGGWPMCARPFVVVEIAPG